MLETKAHLWHDKHSLIQKDRLEDHLHKWWTNFSWHMSVEGGFSMSVMFIGSSPLSTRWFKLSGLYSARVNCTALINIFWILASTPSFSSSSYSNCMLAAACSRILWSFKPNMSAEVENHNRWMWLMIGSPLQNKAISVQKKSEQASNPEAMFWLTAFQIGLRRTVWSNYNKNLIIFFHYYKILLNFVYRYSKQGIQKDFITKKNEQLTYMDSDQCTTEK